MVIDLDHTAVESLPVESAIGTLTRAVDLLIAATAAAAGLPLFTRNAADLAGLEGIVEVVAV